MNDGIKDKHRQAIIDILSANERVQRVVLFGSRAMGTFTTTSDVDLALYGDELTISDQARLARFIDELPMAQRVDLLLYRTIDNEKLREHIRKHGKEWFCRGWGGNADWPFVALTELYEIRSGLSKPAKDFGTGYPFLSFKDVFYNFFVPETLTELVQTNERERESCSIQRGDVFLTRTSETINELGMSCVALKDYENATFNGFTKRLRPKSGTNLLPEYVGYYLRSLSFRKAMMAFSTLMSTRASLNNEMIGRLKLLVPPRKEQKKIAHVLKTLDDKIQLNRQINQTLEEMTQAIFKSWFVDFEPVKAKIEAKTNGQDPERAAMCAISAKTDEELDQLPPDQLTQLRATAALFSDEFIDSELGLIPKGWEVKKIEDIIKRFPVGKKYAQKTACEKGRVPILDQGKSGIIGYHDDKPGVMASPDDPIVVFANHTCYMRLIMHDFSAIQNVLPFKGIDLDIYWVYCATYGKQEFIEYKGHWPDFVIKKVVVPNIGLDEKYGEYVGTFFKSIFQNDLQSFNLAELRDTLLPKLLSSAISVTGIESTIKETV